MKRVISKLLVVGESLISHCSDDTMWCLSDDFDKWSKLPDIPQEEEELFQLSVEGSLPINLKDVVKVEWEDKGFDRANKHVIITITSEDGTESMYSYGYVDLYYNNHTPHQVNTRDKDYKHIQEYLKNK